MKNEYKIAIALCIFIVVDFAAGWFLREGMTRHYGLEKHSKILIIGHSHMMLGLDSKLMERELNCMVSKYTRQGVGMQERHLMTEQYLNSQYSDSLKIAFLGVDCWSFQGKGLSANVQTLFYPFMDDDRIDGYVASKSSRPEYWLHKAIHLSRFNEEGLNVSISGWMGWDKNRKTHVMTDEEFENRRSNWDRPISFNKELMKELENCIKSLTDRNIKVILVNAPTYRKLNESHIDNYAKIMKYYHDLAERNYLVEFWDFNPQYQDSLHYFNDPIHLNVRGQKTLTMDVISNMRKIDY